MSVQQKNLLMKPLGNLKGCIHLKDCRTKTSTSPAPFFWPKLQPSPTICTRKSQNWSPTANMPWNNIQGSCFREKSDSMDPCVWRRTAPKPYSGVVLHGVMQRATIMDSQHQICPEFQRKKLGLGVVGGGGAETRGKLEVNWAASAIWEPQHPAIIINKVAANLLVSLLHFIHLCDSGAMGWVRIEEEKNWLLLWTSNAMWES